MAAIKLPDSIAEITGLQAALDAKATSSHSHAIANVTSLQAALDAKAASASLAAVATSGAYNDLSGKPTLGTVVALNVPASGNAGSGEIVKGSDTRLSDARTPTTHNHDTAYAALSHTHAIANVTSLQAALDAKAASASLAAVATSGVYNDLSGKPTLGTVVALNVPASGDAAIGEIVKGSDTRLADARTPTTHTHAISNVTSLQAALDAKAASASLAAVATSGVYNDLSGKPTLGTAAALNVPASGNAGSGEIVKGSDTRLTNARTPTTHTHVSADITDLVAGAAFDPLDRSIFWLRDDFTRGGTTSGDIGALGWRIDNIDSYDTRSRLPGTAANPGIFKLETSGSAGSAVSMHLTSGESQNLLPTPQTATNWELIFLLKLEQTSNTTILVGLADDPGGWYPSSLPNYIAAKYVSSVGANWQFATKSSGSTTSVDSGTAATTSYTRIRLRSVAAGQVKFSINGGTETTISTNIPASALQPFITLMSEASGVVGFSVDFIAFSMSGLSR